MAILLDPLSNPITEDQVLYGDNGHYPRKRFTVTECRYLQETGVIAAGKFELIDGDIVVKMGQGRPHKTALTLSLAALVAVFGARSLRSQADIGIGDRDVYNDPEPDLTVLRGDARDYLEHEPDPQTDILLVLEVAVSSIEGDRDVKSRIYSRQGIREYWIVDVDGRQLLVFRGPTDSGYVTMTTHDPTESISTMAAPRKSIRVADLLP